MDRVQGRNVWESVMLIYLDEYRKMKATRAASAVQPYEKERECVDPGVIATVSALFCFQHPSELSPALLEDLTSINDIVLDRIYALASQF
jgi:hypothetical protein